MKLIREELAGAGQERFVMHISREETVNLKAACVKAYEHIPRIPATTRLIDQLKQLNRVFGKALAKKSLLPEGEK